MPPLPVGLARLLLLPKAGEQRAGAGSDRDGTTMAANLVIVVSNDQPNREERYPNTWVLYRRGQDAVEVHVVHDPDHRPYVLGKAVA